ncbi:hypothetical protein Tco_1226278 [Tanacetum coccineum]
MSNTNNNFLTQTSSVLHNAIMKAGGKDRPPMLSTGNYIQWKFIIKGYIDTKPNQKLIYYCRKNPPYVYQWIPNPAPKTSVTDGEIKKKMDAKVEAIQIILTGIDNDIYSAIDSCPNAIEIQKAIERLKQDGESLDSYYSRFFKMINELIRNQCIVTNHQVNVQFLLQLKPEWQRGKTIVNSPPPTYDPEHEVVDDDDEAFLKEKEINRLVALISMSFKKIYKLTNNNLRTSSNTRNMSIDNTPITNKGTGYDRHTRQYDNQRVVNVVGARECKKPKRLRDLAYHKQKMLLCKQKEAVFQLIAKQANWRDDSDDEHGNHELEAHYLFMAKVQEVILEDADNSGPIFDIAPLEKVHTTYDHYNVFANERQHPKQPESINDTYLVEKDDSNISPDSSNMCSDKGEAD